MKLRVFALMLASAVAVGCSESPTAPVTMPIQFTLLPRTPQPQPVVISAQVGAIDVDGGYSGGFCGSVGASATRSGDVIEIQVGVHPSEDQGCDEVRTGFNYDLTLLGLQPGRYTVVLYHSPDLGTPELAARQDVTVQ